MPLLGVGIEAVGEGIDGLGIVAGAGMQPDKKAVAENKTMGSRLLTMLFLLSEMINR